jgi:hypothetical protein
VREQGHGIAARLRYWFDNVMSWSKAGRFFLVFAMGMAALFLGALLLEVLAPDAEPSASPSEALWWSWGRVADPGSGAGDTGTGARIAEVVTTLAGVFVFVLLIGFVATAIEEKMGELRKGHSQVVERDHTLICGFNDKVFKIIVELADANESKKDACIVILTERDKEEVMDAILARFGGPKVKTTRIVVRRGSSYSVDDLGMVAATDARAVIVLAEDGTETDGDVRVVKTTLALTRGTRSPLRGHVVAELHDRDHLGVLESVGRDKVETIIAGDFLNRLLVQTARQTGLARVYAELLSFDGDEFYFVPMPASLVGKTFRDAWSTVHAGVVVGVLPRARRAGALHTAELNPADDRVLAAGEELIVLMLDDSIGLALGPMPHDASLPPRSREAPARAPERILVVGYKSDLGAILEELDAYVAPGSEATVVTSLPPDDCRARLADTLTGLARLEVTIVQANATSRRQLEPICARGYDAQVVLPDESEVHSSDAIDARTLMTLLLLRDLAPKGTRTRVISEIRNPNTKELASVAEVGDFVVSDEIVSSFLAQIAENRAIADVWADLCDADGSEIYLKPAWRYVGPGERVSFADLLARARARGEIALGWKHAASQDDAAKAFGIVLNPKDKLAKVTIENDDRIIVIAETED